MAFDELTELKSESKLAWSLLEARYSKVKPFRRDTRMTSDSTGTATTGDPFKPETKDLHVDDS